MASTSGGPGLVRFIRDGPPVVKIMEWQETEVRHPIKGGIALQVHGGGDYTKQFVRYRNIQVKDLNNAANQQ